MCKKFVIAAAMLMWSSLYGLPVSADDSPQAELFGGFATVTIDEMDAARGMSLPFDWNENIPEQALDNNNAVYVHGDFSAVNTIDASFVNASGIATIIQNVGNNVIIQTSTMVTVNYF